MPTRQKKKERLTSFSTWDRLLPGSCVANLLFEHPLRVFRVDVCHLPEVLQNLYTRLCIGTLSASRANLTALVLGFHNLVRSFTIWCDLSLRAFQALKSTQNSEKELTNENLALPTSSSHSPSMSCADSGAAKQGKNRASLPIRSAGPETNHLPCSSATFSKDQLRIT